MSENYFEEPQPDQDPAGGRQKLLLFFVAGAIIIVDHITKLFIEQWLPLNSTWAPIPELAGVFRITHVSNTGAAFGLFPGGSLIFTVIAIIVVGVIIVYNYQLSGSQRLLRLALGLQLGGATGNLVDRLRLGHVTDFLDFGPWPVFNVADASIVAGVVILGILMFREQREEQLRHEREAETGHDDNVQPPVSARLQSSRQNEQAT
ncbi:MAG TPA: signal peptidase II [Candidatus Sulfomarinibacteraceae bacterium]|nr:signal peptidase II [Candidatus Sulfomarinibacteraceae bacterium]